RSPDRERRSQVTDSEVAERRGIRARLLRRPLVALGWLLAACAALLYGDHVARGSLLFDDWVAVMTADAGNTSLPHVAERFAVFAGHRPGYVAYATLLFGTFGDHGTGYLVIGLALAVA